MKQIELNLNITASETLLSWSRSVDPGADVSDLLVSGAAVQYAGSERPSADTKDNSRRRQ